MVHGSLFSGIGGFDLAAQWMGWENKFHCEINEFGQKILKYYWPNAISYSDITKTDFTIHRGSIDILTGGFPCQPFSLAGKRKGTEDDRHLWPEMLRAIREIQPTWIVGENVYGIINWSKGLVFEQVQIDLEAEGYEVQSVILPACSLDAPHRRDRVWFVAYRNIEQRERKEGGFQPVTVDYGKITSNTRLQRQEIGEKQTAGIEQSSKKNVTNSKSEGLERRNRTQRTIRFESRNKSKANADSDAEGRQGSNNSREFIEFRKDGTKQPVGLFQSAWKMFPTQSPLCSRNDGIPNRLDGITFPKWRNESIKGYGNAIVPQVAYQIFKTIQEMQND